MALFDQLFGQRAQVPGSAQQSTLGMLLSPEVALPMAGALVSPGGNMEKIGNAFAMGGLAMGKQRELKAQTAEKNKTIEFLRKNNPELASMIDAGMPVGDAWRSYADSRKAQTPNLTDDQREYQQAREQGFQGTFMDYQVKMKEAGRNQVNIDTGVKLPSGFRWKDPNDQNLGVEPIPGGPGEQIPGELAARVGMADSFLGQLPEIRKKVATGAVTGPVDRALSGSGRGDGANTYRQIESGADALMRLLTGAGMNQTEAEAYARRYLPSYADDADSLAQKLDQLERELTSAKDMAMRGRGGQATPAPAAPAASSGTVVDFRDYFGGQ